MKPITKLQRPREDMLAATFFGLLILSYFIIRITNIAHTNFKVKLKFILFCTYMVKSMFLVSTDDVNTVI